MASLFASISGHGLGHLAQVAPVINELTRRRRDLRVTLQSAIPRGRLEGRLTCRFELITDPPDVGMVMGGPLQVLAGKSLEAYRHFHREWDARIAQQMGHFETAEPDLVLADIPYLPLAAAQRMDIPAIGLCSLNWADILASYCPVPAVGAILDQIRAIYRRAQLFIRPAPSMPMPDLANTHQIGPIAATGVRRRDELSKRMGIGRETVVIAALLGGISLQRRSSQAWPPSPNTLWLVPPDWTAPGRPDLVAVEELEWPMVDVIASVDALIAKPGYGTFAEAACHGTPILCLPREDWPESPHLIDWMERMGRIVMVSLADFTAGNLRGSLEALLALPAAAPVSPSGVAEAADLLLPWLR
jgi:hypothetical protein